MKRKRSKATAARANRTVDRSAFVLAALQKHFPKVLADVTAGYAQTWFQGQVTHTEPCFDGVNPLLMAVSGSHLLIADVTEVVEYRENGLWNSLGPLDYPMVDMVLEKQELFLVGTGGTVVRHQLSGSDWMVEDLDLRTHETQGCSTLCVQNDLVCCAQDQKVALYERKGPTFHISKFIEPYRIRSQAREPYRIRPWQDKLLLLYPANNRLVILDPATQAIVRTIFLVDLKTMSDLVTRGSEVYIADWDHVSCWDLETGSFLFQWNTSSATCLAVTHDNRLCVGEHNESRIRFYK